MIKIKSINYGITITEEEFKEFLKNETLKYKDDESEKHNLQYLTYNENDFALAEIFVVKEDNEIASFCVRPKYKKEVTNRLYTSPEYRKKGYATFLLNFCKITDLSCLKDNKEALDFYLKLGFEVKQEFSSLLNLERNLNGNDNVDSRNASGDDSRCNYLFYNRTDI